MSKNERLKLILVKLDRARSHYADLKACQKSFLDSNPYQVGVKRDPKTNRNVYYVTSIKPTPILIASISGDLIQNLRSTLDHLAYQLVHIGTNGAGPFKNTYFPISEDSGKFTTELPGRTKGMSQAAINMIIALRPYNGGNNTLWQLHKLSLTDKHRSITTVGSAFHSVNITPTMRRHMKEIGKGSPLAEIDRFVPDFFVRPVDNLFPLKVNDELFIDEPDAEPSQEFRFRFNIVFGEPTVEGMPVLDTLQKMVNLVGKTTRDFQSLL
jgi:hypothetical protein